MYYTILDSKWTVTECLKERKRGLSASFINFKLFLENMMKQAQKLQKQMEQSQAELAATQFVGKSAQDLVVATLTGDKKVVSIDFNVAVVDPEDTETLSDMTVQAINAAIEEIDAATKKKLGAFAGKLPF